MIKFFPLIFISILFLGCGTTAQITSSNSSLNCSFDAQQKSIQWISIDKQENLNLKSFIRKTKLPDKFTIYQLNINIEPFLKSIINHSAATLVNVPLEDSCITFLVTDANTMSPELAKKYPDIYSLKGIAADNSQNSIRINYNDKNLKMEINKAGQIYFLDTWKGKNGFYYLLYKKEDAGYEKDQIPY